MSSISSNLNPGSLPGTSEPELLRVDPSLATDTGADRGVPAGQPLNGPQTTGKNNFVALRGHLTPNQKVILVRLCSQHGEEYLAMRKEAFWSSMTTQINGTLKTNIAGARTVVDSLMKKYKEAVAKDEASSGEVFPETALIQALRAWKKWIDRAQQKKIQKKATPPEEEMQRQMTMGGQENMPLPLSKKRTFREALTALSQELPTTAANPIQVSDTTSTRLGTGSPGPSFTVSGSLSSGCSAAAVNRQTKEAQIKKRRMRDRSFALDSQHTTNGERLLVVVDKLANHMMGEITAEDQSERFNALEDQITELRAIVEKTSSEVGQILELLRARQ